MRLLCGTSCPYLGRSEKNLEKVQKIFFYSNRIFYICPIKQKQKICSTTSTFLSLLLS